jgi:hypothetical protein
MVKMKKIVICSILLFCFLNAFSQQAVKLRPGDDYNIYLKTGKFFQIMNGNHPDNWSFRIDKSGNVYLDSASVYLGENRAIFWIDATNYFNYNAGGFNFVYGNSTIAFIDTARALALPEISDIPGLLANYGKFYVKASDGLPYYKNDAGTEYDLTASTSYVDSSQITWIVPDTVNTTGEEILGAWQAPFDITLYKCTSYTDANTVTFNFQVRVEGTPRSASTDSVLTATMVADAYETTTSFKNASISKGQWVKLIIYSAGDVEEFVCNLFYKKVH